MEKKFDINTLAKQLSKSFPNDLVKIRDDVRTIIVMDRIKVTEDGLVEGEGPVADRVRTIFEEFIRQTQEKQRRAKEEGGGGKLLATSGYSSINPRGGIRPIFRCEHCGLKLSSRVYRRKIGGSLLLFCCKQCADHHENESRRSQTDLSKV